MCRSKNWPLATVEVTREVEVTRVIEVTRQAQQIIVLSRDARTFCQEWLQSADSSSKWWEPGILLDFIDEYGAERTAAMKPQSLVELMLVALKLNEGRLDDSDNWADSLGYTFNVMTDVCKAGMERVAFR